MRKIKIAASVILCASLVLNITACDSLDTVSADSSVSPVGPATSTTTMTTVDPDENAATDEKVKDMDTGGYTPSGNADTIKIYSYYDVIVDQKGKEQCMIFESEQYGGDIEWIMTTNGYQFYEKLGTLIAASKIKDISLLLHQKCSSS